MSKITEFSCPHCKEPLSIDDLMKASIVGQLRRESEDAVREERVRGKRKMEEEIATREQRISDAEEALTALRGSIVASEARLQERQLKLDEEAKRIAEVLVEKEKMTISSTEKQQWAARFADMEARLKASEEVSNTSAALESGLRQKLREAEATEKAARLDLDRKLDDERRVAEQSGFQRALEQSQKQIDEVVHRNSTLEGQIAELQRKASVGSQQAQGERMELQLETMLKALFPSDEIVEVRKGVPGADVTHHVVSTSGRRLGTIVWETKNAQKWNEEWIVKLKSDSRQANGDLCVLVTSTNALPKKCNGICIRDGIIICDSRIADSVAMLLRGQITKTASARALAERRESVQATVYEYLAGDKRFFRRIEALVAPIAAEKESLSSEMTYANRTFARRQERINQMVSALGGVYGDLQGMLGDAVPRIPQLEIENE